MATTEKQDFQRFLKWIIIFACNATSCNATSWVCLFIFLHSLEYITLIRPKGNKNDVDIIKKSKMATTEIHDFSYFLKWIFFVCL